ncbi:electron transport complex subunit E [Catenovulum maritimum]|uniref:Ion-translocating oxidoreductase complex subunit E n=1 Tax=Catenovulum maritimum TaxID=1513271 RepID=A0A0J8GW81_9ALTE|nr:electron transport complex subunit E [Catenovulum maritimum]KMT64953.1 elongation factor G [Catenovulum maritimum]
MSPTKDIIWQGIWKNNPAIVQMLGLCPLLAVTNTVINGLGLGIATLFVLMGSNMTVSIVRNWIPNEIRIPVFVMIIASLVTIVQLLMNAYTYELYQTLGIFIPLIVTNCAIIGRAEAFASKNNLTLSALDGLMMGLGFLVVLVLLGAIRELVGNGTLLSGAELLFGDWASDLTIQAFEFEQNFLVAILPPGAFIIMGLIIAAKNHYNQKIENLVIGNNEKVTISRARVTGESSEA